MEPAARDQHPHLTLNAGQLRQAEGRVEEARLLYLRAAADFEARQDNTAQGDSLLALAELELLRGHYTEGVELGRQAMICWDEADVWRRTATLCAIGQLQACQGDLSDAEASLKQAKRLILGPAYSPRPQGHHPLLAFQVLRTQAWVAYLQGAYHRAVGLNRLAEQEAGQDVPPEIVAAFRNPMPAILREWGEGEVAWEATHRQLEVARQTQNRLAISHACTDLGNLYLDREQFAEAEESFRQAIAEAKAAGEDGLQQLYGEVCMVYAHFLQGHTTEAAEVAEATLHRCQARDGSPLELALAQTAAALAHAALQQAPSPRPGGVSGANPSFSAHPRQLLDEAHRTFDRLGVHHGLFISAALIGMAYLAEGTTGTESAEGQADRRQQARRYVAQAMALAAAEGYIQTIVTSRQVLSSLMLFALREGLEPRFVSQVLARMGPESLAGVVEMTQAADPIVRGRAAAALEGFGAQEERREAARAALEQLTHDPDPEVRA